jgi:ABC-2 type transport system permease protein
LQSLGITEHYQSISRGVLRYPRPDIFYIATGIFIWLTLFVLNKQREKHLLIPFLWQLGIMLALSILSGWLFTRFDFTKEKRFTLSPISRKVMDSLPQTVKVTVYLQGDNFPAG